MKKCTFAIAALAVVLFAGCNKEENTVTLQVGGEVAQDMSKEGWCSGLNQVMFTEGDDILLTSSTGVQTYVLNPNTSRMASYDAAYAATGASYYATFDASRACIGSPAYAYYPAAAFSNDGNTVALNAEGNFFNIVENGTAGTDIIPIADAQKWPMVSYQPEVNENTTFFLYNTVALISPAVKFGRNFLISMNEVYSCGIDVTNLNNVSLTIDDIYLRADQPIRGMGYIANARTANEDSTVSCKVVLDSPGLEYYEGDYGMQPRNIVPSNGTTIDVLGNIAVPVMERVQMHMDVYFTLNGQSFVWHGNDAVLNLGRSQRTTLIANLYDGFQGTDRVQSL